MGKKFKIFLASRSPRRHEILSQVFENVELLKNSVVEPEWSSSSSPASYMSLCTQIKWEGASARLAPLKKKENAVLLVADTMVFHRDSLLGKPRDQDDAKRMLRKLSSSEHVVLTSYRWAAVRRLEKSHYRLVRTRVRFRKLSLSEIQEYVDSGDPMDKAGSYGVQSAALNFVSAIEGSYQSVMGFPLTAFLNDLKKKEKIAPL